MVRFLELLQILAASLTVVFKKRERERERERHRGGERGRTGKSRERRKRSTHLEGFQQAHTVTRVIRRNIPPVDRMMYSELLPKPEGYRGERKRRKREEKREED